jgi:hypothetical protein
MLNITIPAMGSKKPWKLRTPTKKNNLFNLFQIPKGRTSLDLNHIKPLTELHIILTKPHIILTKPHKTIITIFDIWVVMTPRSGTGCIEGGGRPRTVDADWADHSALRGMAREVGNA